MVLYFQSDVPLFPVWFLYKRDLRHEKVKTEKPVKGNLVTFDCLVPKNSACTFYQL